MSSQYPVSMIGAPSASPVGISPGRVTAPFKVRGAAAVAGDVHQQDYAGLAVIADSETPTGGSASLGLETSTWSNMAAATLLGIDNDAPGPIIGVAVRNVADLDIGEFVVYGFVNAFVSRSASATVAIGAALRTTNSAKDFVADGGAILNRYMAILQEGATVTTTRQLLECFVNGIGSVGLGFITA